MPNSKFWMLLKKSGLTEVGTVPARAGTCAGTKVLFDDLHGAGYFVKGAAARAPALFVGLKLVLVAK